MACCSPTTSLGMLLFWASIVAFADGCQDVSMYAYQLDKVRDKTTGVSAGVFVFGYRIGMFFAKSAALYLAASFGWNASYHLMAFAIFLCTQELVVILSHKTNKLITCLAYPIRKSHDFKYIGIRHISLSD